MCERCISQVQRLAPDAPFRVMLQQTQIEREQDETDECVQHCNKGMHPVGDCRTEPVTLQHPARPTPPNSKPKTVPDVVRLINPIC